MGCLVPVPQLVAINFWKPSSVQTLTFWMESLYESERSWRIWGYSVDCRCPRWVVSHEVHRSFGMKRCVCQNLDSRSNSTPGDDSRIFKAYWEIPLICSCFNISHPSPGSAGQLLFLNPRIHVCRSQHHGPVYNDVRTFNSNHHNIQTRMKYPF